MKIGLISDFSYHREIDKNINTIIKYLDDYHHLDFLLFSEAFLQGFNSLSWNYDDDLNIAISKNDKQLALIKNTCKKNNIAVGFGFYERVEKDIYCSYLIIDNQGKIINNYRRMSIGWKIIEKTNHHYKEGTSIIPFTLNNYNFITLVCGDLWDDDIKEEVIQIIEKDKIDAVLWPNHLDYEIEQFATEINDYKERTKDIKVPLFLVNDHSASSHGGAVVFKDNHLLEYLKMGEIGIVIFDLIK
ncbi:MAG TPA: carbon-nitrogen hydrolase family protein [Bacilli bacterium]|nr:MAG: Formamidase [Tenericutes bacterium ADurb.BinA124]HNZ50513.1 carbon-nitrogen hydrolase family protein [Bacilli bacterium]HPN60873.1 carbon-nitrogen hydrolase family protein [Bacilli bacterium]HPX84328.1 carbon-nitrogen hydrolase family protein [Bacilli bacterium]